jgi:hypothetical protein
MAYLSSLGMGWGLSDIDTMTTCYGMLAAATAATADDGLGGLGSHGLGGLGCE